MNEERLLVPLTASCQIAIGNLGDAENHLVVEVTQSKTQRTDITTLLLSPGKVRELAEILLQHADAFNFKSQSVVKSDVHHRHLESDHSSLAL